MENGGGKTAAFAAAKTAAFAVWFVPATEGGSKTAAFAVWFVHKLKHFATCTFRYTESSG